MVVTLTTPERGSQEQTHRVTVDSRAWGKPGAPWDGRDVHLASKSFHDRIAMLVSLRDGWDGPGSVRPGRHLVSTIYTALRESPELWAIIGLTAYYDGSVVAEWETQGVFHSAQLTMDGMMQLLIAEGDDIQELEAELEIEALRAFLLGGSIA